MADRLLPCWRVVVRHERESGVLGKFLSVPLSYSDARAAMRPFEATGTPVKLWPIEEIQALNRQIIAREVTYDTARATALSKGLL